MTPVPQHHGWHNDLLPPGPRTGRHPRDPSKSALVERGSEEIRLLNFLVPRGLRIAGSQDPNAVPTEPHPQSPTSTSRVHGSPPPAPMVAQKSHLHLADDPRGRNPTILQPEDALPLPTPALE